MLLNVHSYHSLRYGTMSPDQLVQGMMKQGYDTAVLTDINTTSGVFEYLQAGRERGFNALAGVEFRTGDSLLFIGIARNLQGFAALNELITARNLEGKEPDPGMLEQVFVVYPFASKPTRPLRDHEYIGVCHWQLNQLWKQGTAAAGKYVLLQPVSFGGAEEYKLHRQLRAIDHNLLLSQLKAGQFAHPSETIPHITELEDLYASFPGILANTRLLLGQCSFDFDFTTPKNKKVYGVSRWEDRELLRSLADEGCRNRYGADAEAAARVRRELEIIDELGFNANFLITWDMVRYSSSKGYYHVGRGSGANSVVAYCLGITNVCPIKLDLYFDRFLNPKRKSPPDFDIDYSWRDRDDVLGYILKKYGRRHTALLGAMSTFRDRSMVRELGKVYGLPKREIDLLVHDPAAITNRNELTDLILNISRNLPADFPNVRTVHAGGVLVSELPVTSYTALDLPPKGLPTAHIDMYTAEAIGFEKFDILSQRGIGHIRECAELVRQNQGATTDVHDVSSFFEDPKVKDMMRKADTVGCFYIESPAMRGLLKKLRCADYLTLVAASSIIRPGVAQSGMMREYIRRFHQPESYSHLHPVMEQQLRETFGIMVFQEDVLKVCHHFAGLDLADSDLLRRLMSGKSRQRKLLDTIVGKFFDNCRERGYPEEVTREVWRQLSSFAGFSFSKAHSASYAVESYQSLYLKAHYPLEFMTAVINNFGGFYNTRVYVNEARKAGAAIHLPCVNKSTYVTSITGRDIYLGFIHLQGLEDRLAQSIALKRESGGPFTDMEDFVGRVTLSLEQLTVLVRAGAFRFTGKNKKQLLWEAHLLLAPRQKVNADGANLFRERTKQYQLPSFACNLVEDAYDEMELIGFPVSLTPFDLLRSPYRGDVYASGLSTHVGQTVRMVGQFVAQKFTRMKNGQTMNFGTFADVHNDHFDTIHFPPSLAHSPFKGEGVYLIEGEVVEEFGQPGLEVVRMARMPILEDPRAH